MVTDRRVYLQERCIFHTHMEDLNAQSALADELNSERQDAQWDLRESVCSHGAKSNRLVDHDMTHKYRRKQKVVPNQVSKTAESVTVATDWMYPEADPTLKVYETCLIWFALLSDQLKCQFEEAQDNNGAATLLEHMSTTLLSGHAPSTMDQLREA